MHHAKAVLHEPVTRARVRPATTRAVHVPSGVDATSATYTIRRVAAYLDELRPRMKKYVTGEIELPIWNPQELYDYTTAATQAKLAIPMLYDAPDLLLHRLGSWVRTRIDLNKRVRQLFVHSRNT